jgi:hypothetical protein
MTEMHALVAKGAEANGVTPREFNGLLLDQSVPFLPLSNSSCPYELTLILLLFHSCWISHVQALCNGILQTSTSSPVRIQLVMS